ncbi:MAG TPA: ribonuclease P protein component [Chitinophagaceae bacterium]|nr:ribonuclease P protein component [Chitinophagaceae bacterium]
MTKQLTFGKDERLKSRKRIEQLFSEGKSFAISSFKVFYKLDKLTRSPLQLGVGVNARYFKKSVNRNRIKRLIKESWRLQKNELKEKLHDSSKELGVFLIFTGKDLPEYNFVKEKLTIILNKLLKLVDEDNTTNT